MTLQSPLLLVALAALPLLGVLYVRAERRRGSASFVPAALAPSVIPRRPRWRRHVPVALMALAAAGLVVAMARPQTTEAVAVEQATVVVVSDRSGSMLATDVAPSRLVAARRAARSFVAAVPKDVKVGAIAFNHVPTVISGPTRDHEAVSTALEGVEAAGSTATGDALQAALEMIRSVRATGARDTPAAVVLLSDGKSVRGSDVLTVAAAAKRAGVAVSTVALGTPTGTIPKEGGGTTAVPPDTATLEQVAQRTGGEAFAISDAGKLEQVYEELGSQLATEQRPVEQASLFAGGALILLLAGVVASLRWFGRFV